MWSGRHFALLTTAVRRSLTPFSISIRMVIAQRRSSFGLTGSAHCNFGGALIPKGVKYSVFLSGLKTYGTKSTEISSRETDGVLPRGDHYYSRRGTGGPENRPRHRDGPGYG